jgi:hypothetical protein
MLLLMLKLGYLLLQASCTPGSLMPDPSCINSGIKCLRMDAPLQVILMLRLLASIISWAC